MFEWLFGSSTISKLVIKHDGKTYALTFEKGDYTGKNILLGTLKAKLAPLVDVPAANLNVYTTVPKRKLSNDQATLASYKVHNNATLLVVGEKPKPLTPSDHIHAALARVEEDLGDRIKAFCGNPPTSEKERNKEFLFLNENILQNILKLDNVETEGDQKVRQERKTAINRLQNLHHHIDVANKKSLELIKAQEAQPSGQPSGSPQDSGAHKPTPATGPAATPEPTESASSKNSKSKKKKSKGKKR